MANGWSANATGVLLILLARWFCFVAVLFWGTASWAQSIAELNQDALAAFSAGDIPTALALTLEAVEDNKAERLSEPAAYLEALNNLVFLRVSSGTLAFDLIELSDRAVFFAEETDQSLLFSGLLALRNAAEVNALLKRRDQSRRQRKLLLARTVNTELHAFAAPALVDLAFQNNDFADVPLRIEDMLAVNGAYTAQTDIGMLYDQQNVLEKKGDIAGVEALVAARLLIVEHLQPQLLEEFSRGALWTSFYMNYEAGNFSKAAVAFRDWAEAGEATPEELDFIRAQAEGSLTISQLGGFADREGVQLAFAELTLAYAETLYQPDDWRIGLALRERAYAEGKLGYFDRARATNQTALQNLTQSAEGQEVVHLVLEDLASNAWQRGALEESEALFSQAAVAYEYAVANGVEPLSDYDLSILSLNRARLQIERGAYAQARNFLDKATDNFAAFVDSGEAKENSLRHYVDLAEAEAHLAGATASPEEAVVAVNNAVETANRYLPTLHPDRARVLVNAADQLFVLDQIDAGDALLLVAKTITDATLPQDAPLRSDISTKLALRALLSDERDVALNHLRDVADMRRLPQFRDTVSEASGDFELLAWGLLSQDVLTSRALDEALAALQWTQTSQSAESYAMMAERLKTDDPSLAALLKQHQDAIVALDRNRSALNAAYASGDDAQAVLGRQEELQDVLNRTDEALEAAGTGLTGQAAITPLRLAEIQARLKENEVLVTFLLPGLKPDLIPQLEQSSNLAIAIRSRGFEIAKIPEDSRSDLNDKINAFRCEMATSDENCGALEIAHLRGSMSISASSNEEAPFDWRTAHDLYQDLFGGIQTALRPNDHLIIVPPSDLLRLPFQALITQPQENFSLDSADWLIRYNAVSILPSIAAFDFLRTVEQPNRQGGKFLGVGDPSIGSAPDLNCEAAGLSILRSSANLGPNLYEGGMEAGVRLANLDQIRSMARLPDATCELQSIGTAFGSERSDLMLQEAATEAEVKRLSAAGELDDYDLLVFATHGVISGETSAVAPGLVLSPPNRATLLDDGLLTAAEVATLSLSARLVILSACNTAAGDGAKDEGMSGLASGFFHAGARSLMVTHWAVYSDASAEISSNVARGLSQELSRSNAELLRGVVMGILGDEDRSIRTKHPAYWAPFTIVGL